MMKKVLVLLTVLAMTSVASAVTTVDLIINSLNGAPIDPVKEITINESDWINFDIIWSTDDATTGWLTMDLVVSVDGLGTLDISELTIPTGWDTGFHYDPREIEPGKSYEFGEAQFNGYSGEILLDHLLLHCDQGDPANDVYVSVGLGTTFGGSALLPGYNAPEEFSGIVIHNVPEPMTVALLGLGGLALLRRRR